MSMSEEKQAIIETAKEKRTEYLFPSRDADYYDFSEVGWLEWDDFGQAMGKEDWAQGQQLVASRPDLLG